MRRGSRFSDEFQSFNQKNLFQDLDLESMLELEACPAKVRGILTKCRIKSPYRKGIQLKVLTIELLCQLEVASQERNP
jgi:hypothetical protein